MNWQKLEAEYPRRKRASEARVVRWEWASAPDRSPMPLQFEREKRARGRRMAAPRRPRAGQVAYGLDARGEVAVEREHPGYETFHQRGQWIRYHHGVPETAHRARHQDGRIVQLSSVGRYGGSVERYRWRDRQLVKIERQVRQETEAWEDWFDVTWEGGELTEILGWDPFRKRASILYARPREPLAQLAAAVEARLLQLIPRAVARCRFREPAFSWVLAYDAEGSDMLPPALGVGLASEREAWNPAHYRNYPILFADEKLSVLCRKLNQQLAMKNGFRQGRALLERVCAALRKKSWKRTTPDFVIYAVDFELKGLGRALKQARTGAASRRRRSSRP